LLRSGQTELFSGFRQEKVVVTAPVRSASEVPHPPVPSVPAPVASSVPATAARQGAPAAHSTGAIVHKVQTGDKLLHLLREVYDASDRKRYGIQELARIVKQANPRLVDSNRLVKGEEIVFPKLSGIGAEAEKRNDELVGEGKELP
jgi:hypothetical protein